MAERVLGAEPGSYRNDAVFRSTVCGQGIGLGAAGAEPCARPSASHGHHPTYVFNLIQEGKFLLGDEEEVENHARLGHVFKEQPDTAGADAVWVQRGMLYRCQHSRGRRLGLAKRSFPPT